MRRQQAAASRQLAENERRQAAARLLPTAHCPPHTSSRGFTLIELVMTLMVLSVLAMGVIPLVKASVKRQREQRLREALLQMRTAIDEFKRDTVGMQCAGATATTPTTPAQPGVPPGANQGAYIDPRSRVVISDCTIFNTSNIDRYPPDLETLVGGVSVIPRAGMGQTLGSGPSGPAATENTLTSTKKKIYLREIPIDPMTGERSWDLRSSFDSSNSGSWGGENVFDVRSKSNEAALNGEKYNEW
jgi:general secretion pathway protein G